MANGNTVNPADLVVGNVVRFREKDTHHRYEGKVCYFDAEVSRFAIESVASVGETNERFELNGVYLNSLPYIEDLVVLQVAEPHSDSEDEQIGVNQAAAEPTQDGQNGTNGTTSHASVNQAAGSSSTNTQAGQNGTNGTSSHTSANQAAGSSFTNTQAGQNGTNGA